MAFVQFHKHCENSLSPRFQQAMLLSNPLTCRDVDKVMSQPLKCSRVLVLSSDWVNKNRILSGLQRGNPKQAHFLTVNFQSRSVISLFGSIYISGTDYLKEFPRIRSCAGNSPQALSSM